MNRFDHRPAVFIVWIGSLGALYAYLKALENLGDTTAARHVTLGFFFFQWLQLLKVLWDPGRR